MAFRELFSVRTGWNLWILIGLVLGAIILGVLNNFRVYEEQRVPWFGSRTAEETQEAQR